MFQQLALEFREWADYNFPTETDDSVLLGLCEEVGELCRAHIKENAGIRGFGKEQMEEEIGDIMICLIHYCQRKGLDPIACLHKKWDKVKQRDFVKFPNNGLTE